MPNWVTNNLFISGPKDQRDAFLKAIGDEKRPMSFRKIKPMPESLNIVEGSDMQLAIWAALRQEHNLPIAEIEFKNMISARYDTSWLEERLNKIKDTPVKQEDREVVYDGRTCPETPVEYARWGRAYISNYQKYGCFTWYNWACNNWGTKWDACDPLLTHEEDLDIIGFDTAWSPPAGIVDEMPRMLRDCCADDVKIEWKWAEEQGFFGGVFNISNDDVEELYYEDNESAFDLCEELIGYSSRSYEEEEEEEET